MPVIHVNQLNLVIFVDEVNFCAWNNTVFPHLVDAEVHVFTAEHSHENDIIFRRFRVHPSLVFPLLETNLFA